jgi:short-subunit dehydrogenase
MRQLQGKNVLLTGASRGIGPVIARAFARAGANLGLVARNAVALQELADELGKTGVRAVALAADLEDFGHFDKLIEHANEALGPIDVLVNNAALEITASFTDLSPFEISDQLRIDLTAPILLTRAVLPQLLSRKAGHIVNIGSLAGKSGTPYDAVYGAAKAGLIAFSQSLRAELKGTGVSVSSVSPGFVSDAGMFAAKVKATGAPAPRTIGASTPEAVAAGVLKAIQMDRAEVIVAPGPMRVVAALNQLAPDFVSTMSERLGVTDVFRAGAEYTKSTVHSEVAPAPTPDGTPAQA